MAFESWGKPPQKWHTTVIKATYRIVDAKRLALHNDPVPLTMASEYWDDPVRSSMKFDNDIAPYKPAADIHVVGTARAPAGLRVREWDLSLRVGAIQKVVRATGPRWWKHVVGLGWGLTVPEFTDCVPVRYEQAYGGQRQIGNEVRAFEWNPVGCGFTAGRSVSTDVMVEAPRLDAKSNPVKHLGGDVFPEGFGPCAPVWAQRRGKAGTYDDAWLRERWPLIPDDFDFAFYNSAHPDLIVPGFLKGNEEVEMIGFHDDPTRVRFMLPGLTVFVLARFVEGAMIPAPANLDTLVIDVDSNVVMLTWRARVPLEPEVRVIEARAIWPGGEVSGR